MSSPLSKTAFHGTSRRKAVLLALFFGVFAFFYAGPGETWGRRILAFFAGLLAYYLGFLLYNLATGGIDPVGVALVGSVLRMTLILITDLAVRVERTHQKAVTEQADAGSSIAPSRPRWGASQWEALFLIAEPVRHSGREASFVGVVLVAGGFLELLPVLFPPGEVASSMSTPPPS